MNLRFVSVFFFFNLISLIFSLIIYFYFQFLFKNKNSKKILNYLYTKKKEFYKQKGNTVDKIYLFYNTIIPIFILISFIFNTIFIMFNLKIIKEFIPLNHAIINVLNTIFTAMYVFFLGNSSRIFSGLNMDENIFFYNMSIIFAETEYKEILDYIDSSVLNKFYKIIFVIIYFIFCILGVIYLWICLK